MINKQNKIKMNELRSVLRFLRDSIRTLMIKSDHELYFEDILNPNETELLDQFDYLSEIEINLQVLIRNVQDEKKEVESDILELRGEKW